MDGVLERIERNLKYAINGKCCCKKGVVVIAMRLKVDVRRVWGINASHADIGLDNHNNQWINHRYLIPNSMCHAFCSFTFVLHEIGDRGRDTLF